LAAVQAGHGDGLTYVLTRDDPFGAFDLDNCRNELCSIDKWAQLFMQRGIGTYQEISPSGTGIRIWGLADGEPLNRKFTLEIDGKPIAAELFRRCPKALTITGYRLNRVQQLTNIDKVFDWAVIWGERRKAAAEAAKEKETGSNGNEFNSNGCRYSIDEIEQLVRGDIPPVNRSDVFHTIIGHYVGTGRSAEQIYEHLAQYPAGIGSRYIGEDRLAREIGNSIKKFRARRGTELPLLNASGWTAPERPAPEPPAQEKEPPPIDDPELDEPEEPEPAINEDIGVDDSLDDEDLDDDELDEEQPAQDPNLPKLYFHGQPEAHPYGSWLIKDLIPEVGKGLLAGQWGTGKTVSFIDCATSLMTGQPWLDYIVKRQCAVLLIAGEGQTFLRRRIDAAIREKCGTDPVPFYWYKQCPPLLDPKGAGIKQLIAMARQAQAAAEKDFGLPLGLIGIDTIATCAGLRRSGDEQDNAVGQAIMNGLDMVAQELGCFVFGIDHFGKNVEAGVRGGSAKEAASDVVLACLGNKQPNGTVTDTKLAVRKCRDGEQGREYPYQLRPVDLGTDEDGKPIRTVVLDWIHGTPAQASQATADPWLQGCRRNDQKAHMSRFKRVLLVTLAEHGVMQPIPDLSGVPVRSSVPIEGQLRTPTPDTVRMVDQRLVRTAFALCTPQEPRQTLHDQFKAARDRAEQLGLIGIGNIGDVTFLWLTRPEPEDEQQEPPQ
jgi:hypothetical protein